MADEPMSFSLAWLAEAAGKKPQLTVCANGHMVVRGNTHWAPAAFDENLRALICRPEPDCTEGAP